MTEISKKLDVFENYKTAKGLKSEKIVHRLPFHPSTATPGQILNVTIPKLSENVVFVPGSIGLTFDLAIANGHVNNTVVQNVGRSLVSRMEVKYAGNLVEDVHNYDLFHTYQDLFLSKEEREDRIFEGIHDITLRKHRTEAGDKGSNADYVKLAAIYGRKFRIPINHPILDNHGAFYSRALSQSLDFFITLADSTLIGVTSDDSKDYKYSLSNIQLEYECIKSEYLAQKALNHYQAGKGFLYENVQHVKRFIISKPNTSLINLDVDIMRNSIKGVLFLFDGTFTAGARDSEKFVNPDITKVSISIDGMPRRLYSGGMLPRDFWPAIKKRFGLSDNMTQKDFYKDKFALWIDLRTSSDEKIHGDGLRLDSSKNGVNIELERTVGGSGNITGHMYVVADAVLEVQKLELKNILY